MPIFVLFISAGVSFDGAFSLWVSLRKKKVTRLYKTLYQKMKITVWCMLALRGKRIIAKYKNKFCFIFERKLYKGWSPLSDWKLRYCKVRSFSMCSINCCARPHVLIHSCDWKKSSTGLKFFESLANDVLK